MNEHNNPKLLKERRKERAVLKALVILLGNAGHTPPERYDAKAVLADLHSAIKDLTGGPTDTDEG